MIVSFNFPAHLLGDFELDLLIVAVGELLRAHRRGNHLLIVNRHCARWILNNVPLSATDLALISRLSQEYTQTGGLVNQATSYLRLCPSPMFFPADARCIDITLQQVIDTRIIEEPQLLLEDAVNDGKIYDLIFEMIRRRRKFSYFSFRSVHGGGTGTLRMLQQIVDERRIVAVILDSDRKSPFQVLPSKIRAHDDVLRQSNWQAGVVVCLPCREVENLLPASALEVLPCSVEKLETVRWLHGKSAEERASQVEISMSVAMFFDIKQGADPARLGSMSDEGRAWWAGHLGGSVVKGLGENVARQFAESGRAIGLFRDEISRNGILEMLDKLLERIVWLFAAASPMRL